MPGYIYTLLDHLLFTPKMDFDSRFDITADITYKIFKQFQNNILVQYSLFYSWKLEFSCLINNNIFSSFTGTSNSANRFWMDYY